MSIELTILSSLIYNEEYARKVLPYLKEEYFESADDLCLFKLISAYIDKYNDFPTKEALFVDLENTTGINESTYANVQHKIDLLKPQNTNLDWLKDTTEAFCRERAIYNCIRESLSILDGKSKLSRDAIPDLMKDALAISFDSHVGHDYFSDWEDRYDEYHKPQVRVPFDIKTLNKVTKGGFPKKTFNLWVAGTHVGKAQPLSSRIPTPYGYKTMGDLRPGDAVFGSDGKIVSVTGVYPQGQKQVFKVIFEDGRVVRCCGEHLWRIFDLHKWRVLSINEIIQKQKTNKSFRKRLYIQTCKPVEYVPQNLRIDPYLLGVLLGDGSFRHGVSLTNVDDQILKEVDLILYRDFNMRLSKVSGDNSITYIMKHDNQRRRNKLRFELINLNLLDKLSNEKFIPECYFYGSVEQRIALLQGLLDTDGYIGNSVVFTSTSKNLAEGVVRLVHSLGGKAKIKSFESSYISQKTGERIECKRAYAVRISIDNNIPIFRLSRKVERYKKRHNSGLNLRIVSIEPDGIEECQCISVSANDHLYLTDDYVVTHNTLIMSHCASAAALMGYKVLYISMEMGEIGDPSISQRIDANLLNVALDELMLLPKDVYKKKVESVLQRTNGQIIIKEFPTASAGANHFRYLLNELKLKRNFTPDIIFVDYLNICISSRIKHGSNVNSYTYIMSIAQELRGLAAEFNVPVVSATQLNRASYSSSDPGLDDVADSFGISFTADFVCAATQDEMLAEMNQYVFHQLKNRYSNIDMLRSFVVGVDKRHMRLFDLDQSAQEKLVKNRIEEKDVSVITNKKVDKSKFKGFK